MVEVFKTNISDKVIADALTHELQRLFPGTSVNFDLDDCDRILRVAGHGIIAGNIVDVLSRRGHFCEILD